MKKVWIVLVITVCHYGLYMFILLQCCSMGMRRFDNGGEPSSLEQFLTGAFNLLSFPIGLLMLKLPILMTMFPGPLGHIPFIANSALWAISIYWIGIFFCRRLANR